MCFARARAAAARARRHRLPRRTRSHVSKMSKARRSGRTRGASARQATPNNRIIGMNRHTRLYGGYTRHTARPRRGQIPITVDREPSTEETVCRLMSVYEIKLRQNGHKACAKFTVQYMCVLLYSAYGFVSRKSAHLTQPPCWPGVRRCAGWVTACGRPFV